MQFLSVHLNVVFLKLKYVSTVVTRHTVGGAHCKDICHKSGICHIQPYHGGFLGGELVLFTRLHLK